MFSLICTRINGWVNNGEAGDLRRYRVHYDVTVMSSRVDVTHSGWCTDCIWCGPDNCLWDSGHSLITWKNGCGFRDSPQIMYIFFVKYESPKQEYYNLKQSAFYHIILSLIFFDERWWIVINDNILLVARNYRFCLCINEEWGTGVAKRLYPTTGRCWLNDIVTWNYTTVCLYSYTNWLKRVRWYAWSIFRCRSCPAATKAIHRLHRVSSEQWLMGMTFRLHPEMDAASEYLFSVVCTSGSLFQTNGNTNSSYTHWNGKCSHSH